jgi:CTP:molybdopterin cytidylyltransferase MocA
MKRIAAWSFGCVLVGMSGSLMLANAEQRSGAVLIAGDRPVTEEQVLAKLTSDGWSQLVISRDGRYMKVTGMHQGEAGNIAVDSQTGRLRASENDGDDDEDD